MLAGLPPAELDVVLGDLNEEAVSRLQRELRTVRRRGFAVNDQATEAGLTAVGVAVPAGADLPAAALSLAMPSVRYSRDRLPEWGTALAAAAAAIGRDLPA
jgi:DNA-binding IclR family transcriptional regulator